MQKNNKIQFLFITNLFLESMGICSNFIKNIFENLIAAITFNSERLNACPLIRAKSKKRCPLSQILLDIIGDTSQYNKTRKRS